MSQRRSCRSSLDDATVVNVSSRQAARTLGFLEPRHRDAFEANDIEAVSRAAYEVADLLDDDYGPYTTLATPAHGLEVRAERIYKHYGPAAARDALRRRRSGQLRTRQPRGLGRRPAAAASKIGARVVVDALYGAHAAGRSSRKRSVGRTARAPAGRVRGAPRLPGELRDAMLWIGSLKPPAAIGPGTSAPVDSHGRRVTAAVAGRCPSSQCDCGFCNRHGQQSAVRLDERTFAHLLELLLRSQLVRVPALLLPAVFGARRQARVALAADHLVAVVRLGQRGQRRVVDHLGLTSGRPAWDRSGQRTVPVYRRRCVWSLIAVRTACGWQACYSDALNVEVVCACRRTAQRTPRRCADVAAAHYSTRRDQ